MKEVWKPIKGYNGKYEVSNIGRVRSYHAKIPRMLKIENRFGYLLVYLYNKCGGKAYRIHRLILTAFVGRCPKNHQCAHLNGIRHDNRLENLKWVTSKENQSHKILHGTDNKGEKHLRAKLSESDVINIRKKRLQGRVISSLAKEYGVSQTGVSYLLSGKNWGHIPNFLREPNDGSTEKD